jgi:hypothetical protein
MPCAAPPPDARHNDLMADCYVMESAERDRSAATGRRLSGWLRRGRKAEAAPPSKPAANRPTLNLGRVLARIDWDADPDALRRGDLHRLAPDMTALIWEAARLPAVDALAWSAGLDPVIAVIALLAKAAGKANRSANRLARSLLHNADGGAVERALAELGLKTLSPTS